MASLALALAGCEGSIESPEASTPSRPPGVTAPPPVPGQDGTGTIGSLGPNSGTIGSGTGGGGAGGGAGGGGGTTTGPVRYVCDDKTYGGPSLVRRLTSAEYANAISDVFGIPGSAKYPGAYGTAITGYSTEPALTLVGEQGVEQLLVSAEDLAVALSPRIATLVGCASTGTLACATTFLDTYGRRAFRRSLTADERTKLLAVYSAERADGASFADAVSVMSAMLLQLPPFLYVLEAPSPAGVDRPLTGPELATRLALHLWGSVPDDHLLGLAESGLLTNPAQVLAEAERMFADPRADRAFSRFVREWTQAPRLELSDKDATAFSGLAQPLVDSVNSSFDRFAVAQLRSGANLHGLLRSTDAWVDAPLATFLGLPAVSGWTKVALDANRYSGVMTQPAVMAALAHSAETSYVFRGRVVRKRLMCELLGAPPPNAMAEFSALSLPVNPTAKDLSAAVTAKPACAGCHQLMDPAGLALEHFDAMGRWRQLYSSGKAIDTAGTLLGAAVDFQGPVDLFEGVAALPKSVECVSRQVFRYAASRPETALDNCALQQLQDVLAASGNRLDKAFLAVTQTDTFLYRRGE